MKTGKITAKLRDAVPVCLMVEGKEVKRYKNIELPDTIKEIDMKDFHFYIPMDGKITFQIHYEKGALPDEFPAPRAKITRAEKAAAKAAKATSTQADPTPESPAEEHLEERSEETTALAEIRPFNIGDFITATASKTAEPEPTNEVSEDAEETVSPEDPKETSTEEPEDIEIHYNVNGPRRKELATAVGNFIGEKPKYMRAPTYAFQVGDYTIGRDGTLTGKSNQELVDALTEQGFHAA
ncbi:MAG TPA: hypothetical protein IAA26_05595 [Candidatus Blautia faecipullorum]|nr:hypothetical protein [Candidatus Blautia faecipullorum]